MEGEVTRRQSDPRKDLGPLRVPTRLRLSLRGKRTQFVGIAVEQSRALPACHHVVPMRTIE